MRKKPFDSTRVRIALLAVVCTAAACAWRRSSTPAAQPPETTALAAFVRLPSAWAVTQGAGVTVAVLDWQFDPRGSASALYVNDTSLVPGERMGALKPWHGAWMVELVHHVAPQAKIMPIITRGLTASYRDHIATAIRYAADHGAAVVTSSMGPVRQNDALRDAITYAESRGTIFVNVHPELVMGDSGKLVPCRESDCDARIVHAGIVSSPAHPVTPSASRDVYSWPYDVKVHFEDGWGYSNGPPVIAGVVALMKSANPALRPADIKRLLAQTAYASEGFRVLDAGAAVAAARSARE